RFIVAAILVAIALIAWKIFFGGPRRPDNLIALSGRIEGDDSAVAPKTAGRILEVRVREGDSVKAGDTIAVLDDTQIRAREDQARAAVTAAQAKQQSARDRIAVLQEQLRQSQIAAEQAKLDARGRVHQADAEVAAAEADLSEREAALRIALFDKEAYGKLAETGAVSERQGRQAASTAAQQEAAVAPARRRL